MKTEAVAGGLSSFLESDNRTLREEVRSLQELLALNRQALKIAIAPRDSQEHLPALVGLLFEENGKLLARNQALREEVDSQSCQVREIVGRL